MGGKYLLDTNIVIALLRKMNQFKSISSRLEKYSSRLLFLASYFLAHSNPVGQKQITLESKILPRTMPFFNAVLLQAGNMDASNSTCFKRGSLFWENDIWIAALAMEHGITLVTRDEHFKKIDELKRTVW